MKSTIAFFVKNPIWANAIIFLTILFGVIAIATTNKSFFPELPSTRIYINVFYPGASPVEMEEGVTIKVEEALKGLSDIEEVNSVSSENNARVTITAYQGTDMDVLLSEVKNRFCQSTIMPSVYSHVQACIEGAFLELSNP